nr:hypothetical protein CFP56_52548 [Quercus suber]
MDDQIGCKPNHIIGTVDVVVVVHTRAQPHFLQHRNHCIWQLIASTPAAKMALTNPSPSEALKLFQDIEASFPTQTHGSDKCYAPSPLAAIQASQATCISISSASQNSAIPSSARVSYGDCEKR